MMLMMMMMMPLQMTMIMKTMITMMTSERRASRGQDRQELSPGEAGSAPERGKVSTKVFFLLDIGDILKGKVKMFIIQMLFLLINLQ